MKKPLTINNLDSIINILEDILKNKSKIILSIDGIPYSGKSKLAKDLSTRLNFTYCDGDEEYFSFSTLANFEQDKFLKIINSSDKIITDSILQREIFNKVNIKSTVTIYVKRVDQNNSWIDKNSIIIDEELYFNPDVKIPIENNGYTLSDLDVQIIKYHRKYQPVHNADIIYLNEFNIS